MSTASLRLGRMSTDRLTLMYNGYRKPETEQNHARMSTETFLALMHNEHRKPETRQNEYRNNDSDVE